MSTSPKHDERMANMTFASVYPHYVSKVEKKADFQSSKFSDEFVATFIKTAAALDCPTEQAVEHLKNLENARERSVSK